MGIRVWVVVVLLCTGCSTGSTPSVSPVETEAPTPTVATGAPLLDPASIPPCPAPDAAPAYPDGPLPDGAISVRMCPGEPPHRRSEHVWTIDELPEPLSLGADQVAAEVNALPSFDRSLDLEREFSCSPFPHPQLHMVFHYPGGVSRSVTYGYGKCALLELEDPGHADPVEGTLLKEGGAVIIDTFVDQLLAQRALRSSLPTQSPTTPSCDPSTGRRSMLPTNRLELAVISLCRVDHGRVTRTVIPTDLTEELSALFAEAEGNPYTPPDESDHCLASHQGRFTGELVGWSTWGDSVDASLSGSCLWLGGGSVAAGATYVPVPMDLFRALKALPTERPVGR